jgi:hypothetical protein
MVEVLTRIIEPVYEFACMSERATRATQELQLVDSDGRQEM